jgi:hypothetical protein
VSRTACVYFDSPRGTFGHVTAGDSLMEAASEALDWFHDPHWHGPQPSPATLLEVTLVGDSRRWLIPAQRVMEWRSLRTA